MRINVCEFYDKVLACWLGKNIGGTLGAPMEWKRQKNNVSFYLQDLSGEPIPNDDLDLQLIYLKALEKHGSSLNAQILGEYWLNYQIADYSEYGIAKANMRAGFMPPISGTLNNQFKDSCGAFIRSEIFACAFAGSPELAAKYCYEDGIVDHGNGEGTLAAIFIGAMEAAAFVESDLRKLIDIGLSYIPVDCGVAAAVKTAMECYDHGLALDAARDLVLTRHRGSRFFNWDDHISKEDIEKGFDTGELGYDVPSNIAFIVAAILYGEGDFSKTICTAVNFGEDTDCTAATVGSIFGIIHGTKMIPEKWIEPIGHGIQTLCINKTSFHDIPQTVEELTERTVKLAQRFSLEFGLLNIFDDTPTEIDSGIDLYCNNKEQQKIFMPLNGPRYENAALVCAVHYEKHTIKPGETVKVTLLFHNAQNDKPQNILISWKDANDFTVTPGKETSVLAIQSYINVPRVAAEFEVNVEDVKPKYEAVIELSIPGRYTKLYVPIIFSCAK